ncbi:hypothetical protein V1514DRAFT_327330 [Lipomyces japonicus]|uniref:uncharacterized protein n=1 Tax=Lipomyces japonicus TaxID=56871 RepID=UPI0034CD68D9
MRPTAVRLDVHKILQHAHLSIPGHAADYVRVGHVQDAIVRQFLDFKKSSSSSLSGQPRPIVLTMEFTPVYTFGRRQIHNEESVGKIAQLKRIAPEAQAVYAQRGGQTTFHGPGQLVAYPIIDITNYNLTSKCYVRKLEQAAIELLALYGLQAKTTENTGVWLSNHEKIASIGVHLRRHVTSHGIAINATTDLAYFANIVACGLPFSKPASISSHAPDAWNNMITHAPGHDGLRHLSNQFVNIFAQHLGFDGIEIVDYANIKNQFGEI